MKKLIGLFCVGLVVVACDPKAKVEKEVEAIPVVTQLHRFEQAFYESSPADLAKVKQQYPEFFPDGVPDSVWVNRLQNKDWQALYREVSKRYKDFSAEQTEIDDVFKHVKYYFEGD